MRTWYSRRDKKETGVCHDSAGLNILDQLLQNTYLGSLNDLVIHPPFLCSFIHPISKYDNCCSVAQLCLTLCDPKDCSTPGFPVLHHLLKLAQTHVHWVSDAIQPSCPLLSPFPPALNLSQHQGFSSESALHIRWAKYWSFSFSISPSNVYSGLISFRIDGFDALVNFSPSLLAFWTYAHCVPFVYHT